MKKYLDKIKKLAKEIKNEVKLMEVCGTHTQVIAEYGIKETLPRNIKLISGPGCPVCVTAKSDIDNVISLAVKGIPIASYGDMLRVRGSEMSLADARREGADVREVYTAEEIFKLKKNTVFFGIGFETTSPMTASIIKRGAMVYSAHKAFIPAMRALLGSGEIKVAGLISPGHVAAIVGADVFKCFKNAKGNLIPQVITGFEQEDVLKGIMMLLSQIAEERKDTENEYIRLVRPEGNPKALHLLDEVFEKEDSEWRGLGNILKSGFKLRKEFADRDAMVVYGDLIGRDAVNRVSTTENKNGCLCHEVIKGVIEPKNCSLFKKVCAPENPQGPCMVSREGACHIAYRLQVIYKSR